MRTGASPPFSRYGRRHITETGLPCQIRHTECQRFHSSRRPHDASEYCSSPPRPNNADLPTWRARASVQRCRCALRSPTARRSCSTSLRSNRFISRIPSRPATLRPTSTKCQADASRSASAYRMARSRNGSVSPLASRYLTSATTCQRCAPTKSSAAPFRRSISRRSATRCSTLQLRSQTVRSGPMPRCAACRARWHAFRLQSAGRSSWRT